jgi:DNA-binding NarL/FixJ family response regulator
MPEPMPRVLVVESHPIVRMGLVSILSVPQFGIDVVGECAGDIEASDRAEDLAPDVVLLGLSMLDVDGCQAVKQLLAVHASVRIIVLAGVSDTQRATELVCLGARGLLYEDASIDDLICAIHRVATDQVVVPAGMTAAWFGEGETKPGRPSWATGDTVTNSSASLRF